MCSKIWCVFKKYLQIHCLLKLVRTQHCTFFSPVTKTPKFSIIQNLLTYLLIYSSSDLFSSTWSCLLSDLSHFPANAHTLAYLHLLAHTLPVTYPNPRAHAYQVTRSHIPVHTQPVTRPRPPAHVPLITCVLIILLMLT